MTMPMLNLIDAVLIGIALVTVLFGTARGFVRELLSLIAVVGGFLVAQTGYEAVEPSLRFAIRVPELSSAVAYLFTFFSCSLAFAVAGRMLVKALDIKKTFHVVDHLGGMLLGGAKGLVLVGVLLATLPVWPEGRTAIAHSYFAPEFAPVVQYFHNGLKAAPEKALLPFNR
ncbi:MAG: CvpA family protein [Nitrospirota bacterium]|nr:CvpA family protein [Nitrospirota bacterium]